MFLEYNGKVTFKKRGLKWRHNISIYLHRKKSNPTYRGEVVVKMVTGFHSSKKACNICKKKNS
jgi:hypothetical protein